MQCRRHIDAARVIVGRLEGHVFGPEVCADVLQETAQRWPAPAADIAPALDADMLDDHRRLRQRVKVLQCPGALVGNKARHFEAPRLPVHRLHVHHIVVGVEFGWAQNPRGWIGRCQSVWIEEESLNAVVKSRDRKQGGFDSFRTLDVTSRQQHERSEGESAADQPAPLQGGDERLMIVKDRGVRSDVGSERRSHAVCPCWT